MNNWKLYTYIINFLLIYLDKTPNMFTYLFEFRFNTFIKTIIFKVKLKVNLNTKIWERTSSVPLEYHYSTTIQKTRENKGQTRTSRVPL